MTPRGEATGYESSRSTQQRLTGFKPKALNFMSPLKSPIGRGLDTASTKDNTASGGGQPFGLSNCLFKCQDNESSPEVEAFPEESKEGDI